MTTAKTEMSINDDKGSRTWSKRTYWDTRSKHEGQWWWPRLKWASATIREVGCGLRELIGTPDLSTKGDDNDHNWNEHQQWQGKGDIVWEHLLGHRIRAQRATMTAKTEITISNYRESGTLSERTYWDTRSEHEGQWPWPWLRWTPATTREGWYSLRELTGKPDLSTKGDDDDYDWNENRRQQGKWDVVWENLLGHQIQAQRAMTMTTTEIRISDDKGSGMWSERTYWDTGSKHKGRWWQPPLKWTPATTREGWYSLRELTGTQDQSEKGDDDGQDWNHHQQLQGKWDVVRENLLGHWIQAWRAMTMAKTEMSINDDKGSGTWSKRTYWDTGSEHEGRWRWPRLKWASVTIREVGRGLRELTGTPDPSMKGNDDDHDWNEHQQWQGRGDIVWENLLGHRIRVQKATMMTKAEMDTCNDNESVILVLMMLDGSHWSE